MALEKSKEKKNRITIKDLDPGIKIGKDEMKKVTGGLLRKGTAFDTRRSFGFFPKMPEMKW